MNQIVVADLWRELMKLTGNSWEQLYWLSFQMSLYFFL